MITSLICPFMEGVYVLCVIVLQVFRVPRGWWSDLLASAKKLCDDAPVLRPPFISTSPHTSFTLSPAPLLSYVTWHAHWDPLYITLWHTSLSAGWGVCLRVCLKRKRPWRQAQFSDFKDGRERGRGGTGECINECVCISNTTKDISPANRKGGLLPVFYSRDRFKWDTGLHHSHSK